MAVLLRAGTPVDVTTDDKFTPLHAAAFYERLDVVDQLLAAGADIEAKTDGDWTPLVAAVLNDRLPSVLHLMRKGARKVVPGDDPRYNLVHVAASGGAAEVLRFLIGKDWSAKTRAKNEETPLHTAARSGRHMVVGILVDAGADVDATDTNGVTPLMQALWVSDAAGENLYAKTAKALMARGADINKKLPDGQTILAAAKAESRTDAVTFIEANGGK